MSLAESRRYAAIRHPSRHANTRRSNVHTGALFGLEVEIGGPGVPEWQKTENAFGATAKEIEEWSRSVEKQLPVRAESEDDQWSDCDEDAAKSSDAVKLRSCLTPAENDANQFLSEVWNPLFRSWRELVARAKTGVPWGDDAELRKIQGQVIAARREFSERSGYKFKRELPAWSPDRGFFQAVKESTGVDIPGAAEELAKKAAGALPWTTIAIVAGVGLGTLLLLKSK